MDMKELLEEIRMNRKEIQEIKRELYLFKGKVTTLVSLISISSALIFDYIKKKIGM